jgi:hypothetical protein
MKNTKPGFLEFLDQSFGKLPRAHVKFVCDRVLDRLRSEMDYAPDGNRRAHVLEDLAPISTVSRSTPVNRKDPSE